MAPSKEVEELDLPVDAFSLHLFMWNVRKFHIMYNWVTKIKTNPFNLEREENIVKTKWFSLDSYRTIFVLKLPSAILMVGWFFCSKPTLIRTERLIWPERNEMSRNSLEIKESQGCAKDSSAHE